METERERKRKKKPTSQNSLPSASVFFLSEFFFSVPLAGGEVGLLGVDALDGVFTLAFLTTGEMTSSSPSESWRFLFLGKMAGTAIDFFGW
jgi:hypothetical protein